MRFPTAHIFLAALSVCIGLLALAAFALDAPKSFAYDDITAIVRNPDVRGQRGLSAIWHHDFWGAPVGSPQSHKSWRPLAVFSLRLDASLMGLRQSVLRLVNLGLHVANSGLVAALGLHAGLTAASSAVAAAIFLLHPVQTEAWCPAVGRADLLACFFMLIAVHLAIRIRKVHATAAAYLLTAVALMACAAATLPKETGIGSFAAVLLALLLLPAANTASRAPTGRISTAVRTFLASSVAVAAAVFVAWRLTVTRTDSPDGAADASSSSTLLGDFSILDNSIALEPARVARALTIAHTHSLYASLLAWPFGRLSALHGFGEIEHVRSIGDWRAAAAFLVYAAVSTVLYRLVQQAAGSCQHAPAASQAASKPAPARKGAGGASTAPAVADTTPERASCCKQCEERRASARRRLFFAIGLAAAPFFPASNVPM